MKKSIAIFEILLLVGMSFSFAYLIEGTNENYQGVQTESQFIKIARALALSWLSGGLVSAQEEGLWTCLENLDGTFCQEYPWNECNDNCNSDCFMGPIGDYSDCQLGLCYDNQYGDCLENTPRAECENWGGAWYEDDNPTGQILCAQNCCLGNAVEVEGEWQGDSAQYITSGECDYYSSTTGIPTEWVLVEGEIQCLAMANSQAQGACLLEEVAGEYNEDGVIKRNCMFTTTSECLSLGGDMSESLLCTNEDLNTICEKTEQTECEPGGDKVYYTDSCGNFANVYDSTQFGVSDYWSRAFNYEELCELGSQANPFSNQATCGTCNYLLGSKCGTPIDGVDDSPVYGNHVCRDLGCEDEWGDERDHGESWCAFDSRIGVVNDGQTNNERSVDLPGSRHYRRVCFEGEVRTEPCADSRQEVCLENRDEQIDFSSAACRINLWQTCFFANTDEDELEACEENTDCTLKKISIGEDYQFDVCTPKYPPGFDFHPGDDGEGSTALCSLAGGNEEPFKCKRVEVKKLFSGWSCKRNCDCTSVKFTESMNNLCISLGDCGGNVNLAGEYDKGYSIKRAGNVRASYIESLRDYTSPPEGQSADQLNEGDLILLFPHLAGLTGEELDSEIFNTLGMLSGGAGIGMVVLAQYGYLTWSGLAVAANAGSTGIFGLGGLANAAGWDSAASFFGYQAPQAAGLTGVGAGIAGGLAGAAVVFLLLEYTGVSAGLPAVVTIGLIAGGAFAGAVIGGNLVGASWAVGGLLTIAIVVLIIVIVLIIIFAIMGIGKSRTITAEFSCLTWQPPTGGSNCESCNPQNEFDLPCSEYKCESFGQTCVFANEGTSEELCYDSNPNDVTSPIITPWLEQLSEGFEYVENANGIEIIMDDSDDGCLPEYTPVNLGLLTNEPAQCKVHYESTSSYEDMDEFFGDRSTYIYEHPEVTAMPNLVSLGVPGADPDRRGVFSRYVRCQDGNGNSNVNEYVVNFCVSPAEDFEAPLINLFNPDPGYAGFETSNKPLAFYTNEPAECRWSLEDISYDSMDINTICEWDPESVTQFGWRCDTILDVPDNEEETINYYIRCADQPWIDWDPEYEDYDLERNVNQEGIVYQLTRTTEELIIDYVSPPEGEIISAGDFPVPVEIEIHTSGGINGNAACEFSFGEDNFLGFFNTGGTEHTQTFSNLYEEGTYNLDFMCTDFADNVATASTSFIIEVDNEGPVATRVYDGGGTLTVITNENAECAYSHNSCSFNFEEESLMSGNGLVHTTSFEFGLPYYIKCKDAYGNVGSCLSITGGY